MRVFKTQSGSKHAYESNLESTVHLKEILWNNKLGHKVKTKDVMTSFHAKHDHDEE